MYQSDLLRQRLLRAENDRSKGRSFSVDLEIGSLCMGCRRFQHFASSSNSHHDIYLHNLVLELSSLILPALEHPRDLFCDLFSFIRASAPVFRAYIAPPELILLPVLRNAILQDSFHHALAVLHVPAVLSTPELRGFELAQNLSLAVLDDYCRVFEN